MLLLVVDLEAEQEEELVEQEDLEEMVDLEDLVEVDMDLGEVVELELEDMLTTERMILGKMTRKFKSAKQKLKPDPLMILSFLAKTTKTNRFHLKSLRLLLFDG